MTGPFHPKIILDTCIFSYIFKGHSLAIDYLPYVDSKQCYLTFMTIGELYQGAYKANWGHDKKVAMQKQIQKYSIINSNQRVAMRWAYVMDYCKKIGQPIHFNDAWQAACSLHYNFPLLTHNIKHFEYIPGLILTGPGFD